MSTCAGKAASTRAVQREPHLHADGLLRVALLERDRKRAGVVGVGCGPILVGLVLRVSACQLCRGWRGHGGRPAGLLRPDERSCRAHVIPVRVPPQVQAGRGNCALGVSIAATPHQRPSSVAGLAGLFVSRTRPLLGDRHAGNCFLRRARWQRQAGTAGSSSDSERHGEASKVSAR